MTQPGNSDSPPASAARVDPGLVLANDYVVGLDQARKVMAFVIERALFQEELRHPDKELARVFAIQEQLNTALAVAKRRRTKESRDVATG